MKNKYNHFIEKYWFLVCLISAISIIKDIIFLIEVPKNIIMGLALISIISSVTAFIRILIWKTGNYALTTSDALWRVIRLKNQEDKYRKACLKHAKYAFLIACAVSSVEVVVFSILMIF